MNLIKELSTPRLKLIGLTKDHLEDLFHIYSDEETMKYWNDFPHPNLNKTKELYNIAQARMANGSGKSWGIQLKGESSSVIGTISYDSYKKDGLATIGYILSKKFWNKGLMTEALREFIEYGFSELGIHRIEAHVEPGNIYSKKLLLSMGFKQEGLLRERNYYKNGYQSVIIFGLIKTDKRKTKHNTR